jgi:hypothetical protein
MLNLGNNKAAVFAACLCVASVVHHFVVLLWRVATHMLLNQECFQLL